MKKIHVLLWEALDKYVGEACHGRDDSHGLPHMRKVTEHAIALFRMTQLQQAAVTLASHIKSSSLKTLASESALSLKCVKILLTQNCNVDDSTLVAFFSTLDEQAFSTFNNKFLLAGNENIDPQLINLVDGLLNPANFLQADSNVFAIVVWARVVVAFFKSAAVPKQQEIYREAEFQDVYPLSTAFGSYFATLSGTFNHTTTPNSATQPEMAFDTALARCIVIGMLHDVNDHKYEKPDGSLSHGLRSFVDSVLTSDHSEFKDLLFPSDCQLTDASSRSGRIMQCVSAISFSKEKKNGMRYFESELGKHWTAVRDWVSDADKLEAIGEGGLLRCWLFNLEMKAHNEGASIEAIYNNPELKEKYRQANFQNVKDHVDEKLAILNDKYIVTTAGKRLGGVAHNEMLALLEVWNANGPPQL